MSFAIGRDNPDLKFILSEDEWPGVRKIAYAVAGDVTLVTGTKPGILEYDPSRPLNPDLIYAGTAGHSGLIDDLVSEGLIDVSRVEGRREVFAFGLISVHGGQGAMSGSGHALVIAGSDKRGTIYGLFYLSRLMGVSPWVWFADVKPARRSNIYITDDMFYLSKEPSVEYRGIFINDEWPSFGNWTFERYGGFTAQMYEHVFELILRLNGNYLWPAMWTSNFSLDGPGLENAILADEMGIVMSNSHHEPCLRHSEEWDLVKGDDTPYGSAWNFDLNREGLTNYWRDGLKRNGVFENIVTMGMRGERDSEILGHEATLKENVDYIKEVVKVQNDLIKVTINADLSKVPRMIAIYKEVEQYYYGDESTPGLKDWDGLDGITCMLCEDNHGNMRGLPTGSEADRDGGFGMYYHFDYHGGPISYEWINSTTIAKTWEQMSEAYEAGVRKIWIVNTGDLKPQELPISFFMDLAYDYDKWGASNTSAPYEYLKKWVAEQFGSTDIKGMSAEECISSIEELIDGYTYLNLCRKPEALNERTYHPFNYGESDLMLSRAAALYRKADELGRLYTDTPLHDAYEQLVGYPVRASANLLYMQLCAGKNAALASSIRPSANIYAKYIDACFRNDAELTDMYHKLADGKWKGMMSSEHIGFANWNEEESRYPVRSYVYPYRKKRMVVSLKDSERYTTGEDWTRKTLYAAACLDPKISSISVRIENAGTGAFTWTASSGQEWVSFSAAEGSLEDSSCMSGIKVAPGQLKADPADGILSVCELTVFIDRARIRTENGNEPEYGAVCETRVKIDSGFSHADIVIPVVNMAHEAPEGYIPTVPASYLEKFGGRIPPELTCNETGLVIDADCFSESNETDNGRYVTISPYGKYRTAIKAYPVTKRFGSASAPSVSYNVYAPEEGDYDVTLITAPSNPIDGSGRLCIGLQAGDNHMKKLSMVDSGFMGGENSCFEWCVSVLDQEHRKTVSLHLNYGDNKIRLYALDPGAIPERLMIRKSGTKWSAGYLGPVTRN